MENSLAGLMMAAGTVVTCIIISLGFFLAREGKGLALEASNQMQEARIAISEQGELRYDRVYLTGTQVIAAIKKYETDHTVTVTTAKQTMQFPIRSMEQVYDPGSVFYIQPDGRFWSTVVRNGSGIITGFQFVQK